MIKHLYAVPAANALQFSAQQESGRTVYRKDAVRAGRYFVPHAKMWADIPPERLDHWAQQFSTFTASGRKVYFTVDHKPGVEARRGEVVKLFRDGDRLMFDVLPSDAEAEALIKRNPEVSIEADPVFTDSTGRKHEDVITAISAVLHPVVPDQQPFVPLVASVEGSGEQTGHGVVLRYDGNSPASNAGNDPKPNPKPETDMFTPEQLKQLRLSLKAGDDVKDDALPGLILERLGKPAPEVQQLADAQKTILSLQTQVETLEKGKTPEVDTDVLEQQAELVGERLSLLVEKGNITQAIADDFRKVMVGESGKRPKLMLSAKVATAAGLPEPLHKPLLNLLGKLQMGVRSGQMSGTQTLNRGNPDGASTSKADDWVQKEVEAANAASK